MLERSRSPLRRYLTNANHSSEAGPSNGPTGQRERSGVRRSARGTGRRRVNNSSAVRGRERGGQAYGRERRRTVQSLILSGKNILQELLSYELTTMRHVSFIQNLDNLDAHLYFDRQSSNILTNEIQSNLNLLRNGSYAAKAIECSNYKQGRTFSFIKQFLNKII